jgi:hypothetical protein
MTNELSIPGNRNLFSLCETRKIPINLIKRELFTDYTNHLVWRATAIQNFLIILYYPRKTQPITSSFLLIFNTMS